MRLELLCITLSVMCSASGADKSIGIYGGMNQGNIARAQLRPVTMGGFGLLYNHCYKRLMLQGGLFVKRVGGSMTIGVVTRNDPDALYTKTRILYSTYITGVSLGIHDVLIQSAGFRLSLGVNIDNGLLIDPNYKSEHFDPVKVNGFNPHFLGITPKLGVSYDLSLKKFIFLDLGLSEQLNTLMSDRFFYFHIRHTQLDIGFACRLEKTK